MNKLLQIIGNKAITALSIVLLLLPFSAVAQTDSSDPQTICIGSIEYYQVDYTENGGAGTTGSTYTWSITSGAFAGTLTPNQGPAGSSNRIEIDWGASPDGAYVLQVIETNNGCDGPPIELNIIIQPTVFATTSADICIGETYTLPSGLTVSSAGTYNDTITSLVTGCDSVITVDLNVNPILTAAQTLTICDGQTATLPDGSTQSTAGDYTTTLTSAVTGCDSVITTTVVVNPILTAAQTLTICDGQTATLPDGSTQSTAGDYAY
ncbi:MAG: hypothetical protein R2850_01975 [Bacteroidia bacterium]